MKYDREAVARVELLHRYDLLERRIEKEGIPSGLRRGQRKEYRELVNQLVNYYEIYKEPPLNGTHLRAANDAFSKRLDEFKSEFEKLMGGK